MKQHFEFLKCFLQSKVRDEKGATMVEYGLMLSLIAVACIVAVGAIGTDANAMFESISEYLTPVP